MQEQEAKEYNFSIREFQKTQSDAQQLADCYNTFDDPESWPGGFGHGEPTTAEEILESMEKHTPLSKFVAISDGKIVGHCDVLENAALKDVYYVGLLGVDPKYQGKKIGKNLLLKANERVIELEKDVITLHTWGGNLKGVPLYKKAGYFWAPETSVYMESFMPGILRLKLFKRFFDKYDWYTTYKRTLSLLPDEEKISKMNIYNNYFEADKNNSLNVMIDRHAKKICGFELKSEEGSIGATCLVDNHIGYVGYGKVLVKWILKNETKQEKQYALYINKTSINLEKEPEVMHVLKPGETKTIESWATLELDVETKSNPNDGHLQTEQIIETLISFDDEEIDLTVGIIPLDPLVVEVYPRYISVIPGEKTNVPLRLWNRTEDKIKGSIIINEIPNVEFESNTLLLNLESKERIDLSINFQLNENYNHSLVSLKLNIFKDQKNERIKLPEEFIQIPVIDYSTGTNLKCSGYIIENKKAILENNTIRLEISLSESSVLRRIFDKRDGKFYYFGTAQPDLGLPFMGYANEFKKIKHTAEIVKQKEKVSLILTATSLRKKGIKLQRTFTIKPNNDLIEIMVKIVNESSETHKDIAIRMLSDAWGWGRIAFDCKTYLPLNRGLMKVDDNLEFHSSRHYPKDVDEWKESWICTEFDQAKLFGFMWDKTYLKKIEAGIGTASTLEYDFGTLEPGQHKQIKYFIYFGRGNWKDFRKLWQEQIEKDSSLALDPIEETMTILDEFTIETESSVYGKMNSFNIQPINYDDTLNLIVNNNTLRKIKGKLVMELPKGVTFEDNTNMFESEINELVSGKPYENIFKIYANEIYFGRIFFVKLSIVIEGTSFDLSFLAQILNKDFKINIQKNDEINNKELYTIDNGKLLLSISKDHGGSVTSFKIPTISKSENLLSSWPEVKTFMWDSHWFGGIVPIISNPYSWGSITHLEEFISEQIDNGLEKGIKVTSKLKSKELLEGLQLEIDYTTLPFSNAIKATFRVLNNTKATLRFRGGLDANIAVSERVTNDIFFEINGVLHKRTFQSQKWIPKMNNKWVVFVDQESKIALAIIGPTKRNLRLIISDDGELLNSANTINELFIPAKSKVEYDVLYILYPLNHELIEHLRGRF